MQIIASPAHAQHDPPFEIIDGQRTPYFEVPRRAAIIAAALAAAGFPAPAPPRAFGVEPILAVHTPAYLAYLERAYGRWVAAGRSPEG
ncbi:MAG: histone deacetylase family protein, partial [Chloroflexales bacterium]